MEGERKGFVLSVLLNGAGHVYELDAWWPGDEPDAGDEAVDVELEDVVDEVERHVREGSPIVCRPWFPPHFQPPDRGSLAVIVPAPGMVYTVWTAAGWRHHQKIMHEQMERANLLANGPRLVRQ